MSELKNKLAGLVTAAGMALGAAQLPTAEQPGASVYQFDPSQRRLMDDEARVIVVVWHRQKGKDYTAAAKAVKHSLLTGQPWFIVSLTQRQADATFEKCKNAARRVMKMLQILGETEESSYASEQYDKELDQSFTFLARELRLPGGGRVVSLPGRDPDTLAGLTGNVIFTEFGLFPNGGFDHWRVVFPLTTRGFQCIVISTPRGKNTKFYELFVNTDGAYSVHFCDIYKSIAEDGFVLRDNQGNPTDVETFKRLYGDASGFEREYECKFTGDLSALVTWAELERAAALDNPDGFVFRRIDDQQSLANPIDAFRGALAGKRLGIGWDVARRGHLSVITVNVLRHNRPANLAALIAMRNCSFEFQRAAVTAFMETTRNAVGFGDATGLGMESNEILQKKYRDRWTPFTFTGPGKREVASALKTAFSDGTQTIPALNGDHKFVATDIYAIQADNTGANLIISETPNPLLDESHCDIAFSLGLARLAGASNAILPLPPSRERKPVGW